MAKNDHLMYVGTFTSEFKTGTGELMGAPAEGIGVFEIDASTGNISQIETIPGLVSPSWLAFHPKLPVLYALERRFEVDKPAPGALSSYTVDERTGHLELTSRVQTGGASPAFVGVHPSGRHAYAVHFQSGHVVAFPLEPDGRVGQVDTAILHKVTEVPDAGSRPVHHHQKSAHPHQARPAPNGRYVTVSDVGMNVVMTYPTNEADGTLSSVPSHRLELPPGTGPRHHVRHPSGKFMFACGEINSTMCVMALDDATGELQFLSALPTVPEDYVEGPSHVGPGEIAVHPSGRAIYVSNRGHDSIAVYSFDETTGSAKFLGTQTTFGMVPRNFNIDPTGTFLIAANQTPGSLVRFRLDPATMWPNPDGFTCETPTPVCIVFRPRSS